MRAEQPHSQTHITVHKYGDTDYLNRIWVNGQRYGMKVDPTKAETNAARNANVVEHAVVAANRYGARVSFRGFVRCGKHGMQTPNAV
jgi:hypothetical protein